MNKLIKEFKDHVIKQVNKPDFVHYKWFVRYHLEIVEKIALELCDIYKKADKNLVLVLVWLHDYGKIINFNNKYEASLTKGKQKLIEIGFSKQFIDKAISYVDIIDKKVGIDLDETPIEIKIISSADGASHLVGPFFPIWLYENANKDLEKLMKDNIKKIMKDWNKKIVLPEIRKLFKNRYEFILEQQGQIPVKFLGD